MKECPSLPWSHSNTSILSGRAIKVFKGKNFKSALSYFPCHLYLRNCSFKSKCTHEAYVGWPGRKTKVQLSSTSAGVGKLDRWTKCSPPTASAKTALLEQSRSFRSTSACTLQQQSQWPIELKIITLWPFTGQVCWPLIRPRYKPFSLQSRYLWQQKVWGQDPYSGKCSCSLKHLQWRIQVSKANLIVILNPRFTAVLGNPKLSNREILQKLQT